MSRTPVLTEEQIAQARALKAQGYSNREIADIFNVAKSTIWDNVYKDGRKVQLPSWRRVHIAIEVIRIRKREGLNSKQVSDEFKIPLKDVNFIWGRLTRV